MTCEKKVTGLEKERKRREKRRREGRDYKKMGDWKKRRRDKRSEEGTNKKSTEEKRR